MPFSRAAENRRHSETAGFWSDCHQQQVAQVALRLKRENFLSAVTRRIALKRQRRGAAHGQDHGQPRPVQGPPAPTLPGRTHDLGDTGVFDF